MDMNEPSDFICRRFIGVLSNYQVFKDVTKLIETEVMVHR